ncbi:MAG: hypothetical protein CL920_21525 [Deltaproteobacteria bacterium]|nr:hypothetical protein [Deltaproteobacteria bacterium]MBU51278.1 hypothetical protein [Deltaproteobacteria bacterium]|tara:strand:- start:240 stop:3254 length:3015 start_codon:yes stop_codon:yes gene_type:complete
MRHRIFVGCGLVCLLLLGCSETAWSHRLECPVDGHHPIGSWNRAKVSFEKKKLLGFEIGMKFLGGVGVIRSPSYTKRKTPLPLTSRQLSGLSMVFRDTFEMYRMHLYPFPRRWMLQTPDHFVKVFFPGMGSTKYQLGGAEVACVSCPTSSKSLVMSISFMDPAFTNYNHHPEELIQTIGHEVMHIVQYASPNGNPCTHRPVGKDCFRSGQGAPCYEALPFWWKESTANAMGFHLIKHLRRQTQRIAGVNWNRFTYAKRMGVRNFYKYPLDASEDVLFKNGKQNPLYVLPYKTNSFWQHLAEYYYPKEKYPFRYLKKIMYDRSLVRSLHRDHVLSLTSRHFIFDKRRALPHIFATFLTHTAAKTVRQIDPVGMGELLFNATNLKKPPMLKSLFQHGSATNRWFAQWFGGCEEVELDASILTRSSYRVAVNLGLWTGKCIRVKVKGLPPNRAVSVKILGETLPKKLPHSQLHMGMAYTSSQSMYYCRRPGKGKDRMTSLLSHCLVRPLSAEKLHTWHVPAQRLRPGQTTLETVYVVSRTPLLIRCSGKDSSRICIRARTESFKGYATALLTFSLKSTKNNLRKQKKIPKKKTRRKTDRTPSKLLPTKYMLTTLNFWLAGNSLSSIPLSGDLKSFSAKRPVRHLFEGNLFNKLIAKNMKKYRGNGLYAVLLKEVLEKATSNKLGEVDFKTLATFTFMRPKSVIPFGKTGTFKGFMMGRVPNDLTKVYIPFGKKLEAIHKKIQQHKRRWKNIDRMKEGLQKELVKDRYYKQENALDKQKEHIETHDNFATLVIYEFSKESFRARLTGRLCQLSALDFRSMKAFKENFTCPKLKYIDLDINHPFPPFYTGDKSFVTKDTKAIQTFRKYEQPFMLASGRIWQASQERASNQQAPAVRNANSGVMGGRCPCTCQDKELFEKLQAERIKNPKKQPTSDYVRLMLCQGFCFEPYKKCKSKKKSVCDCSCAYRKQILEKVKALSRAGKNFTPEVMTFYRCAPMCAMAHASCFKQ